MMIRMHWLIDDWHNLVPQPWASGLLVLVAVLCGGIVGIERERKQKAVGVRTLALVCLGATVFTMISTSLGHVTPIAGQIVSGIGFLGAGVILRGPFGITGLTSAATIWAMAAVGMTIGIGYAGAGLVLSVFLLAAMLIVSMGEQRYIGRCQYRWAVLTFRVAGGKSLIRIEEVLDEYRFARTDYELIPSTLEADPQALASDPAPLGKLRVRYCDVHRHHREFLAFLAAMPEVEEIQRMPLDVFPPQRIT